MIYNRLNFLHDLSLILQEIESDNEVVSSDGNDCSSGKASSNLKSKGIAVTRKRRNVATKNYTEAKTSDSDIATSDSNNDSPIKVHNS